MPEDPNTSSPPPAPPPSSSPEPPHEDDQELEDRHRSGEKVMTVLAEAMPWVISLLFHLGLFLIMMFFVFIVLQEETPEDIIVPDAVMSENPGGRMTPSDMTAKASKTTQQSQKRQFVRKTSVTADAGKTTKPVDIIGVGGGGAASASKMGMAAAGGGGPRSTFFGSGGNAFNVVYVIDRSGSMVDTFDLVRLEMLRSIGRLRETQMFHIILFAEGRPIENAPRKLIPATRKNKKDAASFLADVTPETQTDPIPALLRAFTVLRGAKKRGKLVYLLTDGVFPDNKKVLATIQEKNTGKNKVYINTFLYGTKPPAAVDVMTKIAGMTGGRYTFVRHEQ